MHTEQKYFKTEDDEGEEKQAPQFAIKLTIKNQKHQHQRPQQEKIRTPRRVYINACGTVNVYLAEAFLKYNSTYNTIG